MGRVRAGERNASLRLHSGSAAETQPGACRKPEPKKRGVQPPTRHTVIDDTIKHRGRFLFVLVAPFPLPLRELKEKFKRKVTKASVGTRNKNNFEGETFPLAHKTHSGVLSSPEASKSTQADERTRQSKKKNTQK